MVPAVSFRSLNEEVRLYPRPSHIRFVVDKVALG